MGERETEIGEGTRLREKIGKKRAREIKRKERTEYGERG